MIYSAIEQNIEAANAFREAIRIEPNYFAAYNNLGIVCAKLGQHQEAIEFLKQAIKMFPENTFAYFSLGCTYAKINNHEEAVEAYFNMAISYSKLQDKRKVIEAFEKVVELDPGNACFHYCLGEAYWEFEHLKEAFKQYKLLKRIDPNRAIKLFSVIKPLKSNKIGDPESYNRKRDF